MDEQKKYETDAREELEEDLRINPADKVDEEQEQEQETLTDDKAADQETKQWGSINLNNQGEPVSGFFEGVYGVFFQPAATFRQLGRSGRFRWGLLVYILVFLFGQAVSTTVGGSVGNFLPESWGLASVSLISLIFFPFAFGLALAYTAILHAIASLMGGKGQFRGFFVAFTFAGFPAIVISLLDVIRNIGGSFWGMMFLLQAVVVIWILVLQIIAIRESHRVSTAKAVIIYLAPLFSFFLVITWMILLSYALLPQWFAPLF